MCWHAASTWDKHGRSSLKLKTILKSYMTLPITGCKADRNYSKLSIVRKFSKLEGKFNYLSVLSTENNTSKFITLRNNVIVCRQWM